MRKLRIPASAGLAGLLILLAAACGNFGSGPGGTGTSCVNPTLAHRAYVVVEHLSGSTLYRCVGFSGATIAGDVLMKGSGLVYQTQHFSFGEAVCAIDKEPASFDQCLPQNEPYWGLWTGSKGGSWQQAQTGFTQLMLGDGDAMGWRYTPATEASPAPPPAPKK